jgi:hypothetical protein
MKSLFVAVLLFFNGLFQSHHPAAIKVIPAPSHAADTSVTAAVFNATVASLQPQAGTATSIPASQPPDSAQATTSSPVRSNPVVPAPVSVLTASAAPANYVTQDELATQLQITENNLRTLVYQNTNGGTEWQVGQGEYASGGYTNNIAVSNPLDQLNGTTLTNVTVNGISGITASNLPPIDLTSKVTGILPIESGGTGTSTVPGQNKVLLSDASGNWEYAATSSLGISGGATLTGITGQVAYFIPHARLLCRWNDLVPPTSGPRQQRQAETFSEHWASLCHRR